MVDFREINSTYIFNDKHVLQRRWKIFKNQKTVGMKGRTIMGNIESASKFEQKLNIKEGRDRIEIVDNCLRELHFS